jgi:peptide chain release factor 1
MFDREYIEKRLVRIEEIETNLSNPEVISKQKKYRELLREHTYLKRLQSKSERYFDLLAEVEEYRELIQSDSTPSDLKELAEEELPGLEEKLPVAESALMLEILPPLAEDTRNAIMEIRAGTGGSEAALFAGDLFRMYSRFCEKKGWKINTIDASMNEVGGYKEIVFAVEGDDVYAHLKYEGGGHRVQRIPATESSGRIHTSAATVAVFPEVEEEDDIKIPADDLRIDIYCASGPGGQGVNTTYSAVRVTHVPTGIVAQSQDERSQHRNKEKAMGVMKARLLDHLKKEEEKKKGSERKTMIGSGDRSDRIRTYNFPQNRLSDHRIDLTVYSLDRIIEGEMDGVIDALREHEVKTRLELETTRN